MDSYKNIEEKLHQFVRKFYTNELIKGTILFLSLGFLYFFFTLFIEYFLWLKPTARTILFVFFILVESYLVFRFILTPIFKLIGLKKGISFTESSKIIGNHFPNVADKLINVLQLKEATNQSDLLIASIEQKSKELQPIPFTKAVNYKQNSKYLKYAAIPVFIWLIITITGNFNMFDTSFKRVVNYRTAFAPPAPFSFHLINQNLKVIQGKPFTLEVETKGKVTPTDVTIFYNNQSYFLQNQNGIFSYTFTDTRNNINFYVEANGITSENYELNVIKTPTIQHISIDLNYPKYIGKKNETINNTGTILIPEGTKTTWNVATNQTDSVAFISVKNKVFFNESKNNVFTFSKRILKPLTYQIATSNSELKEFEKLYFTIDVVKDEFPEIEVLSDIDSLNNTAQFAGKFSDDYGIKKLEIVFYDEENPTEKRTQKIAFDKEQNQTFYYNFPGDLKINKGINYEVYFQVFDNDAVNGSKKSESKKFSFRKKTDNEIEEESVLQQRKQIKSIENTLQKKKDQKKELEEIKQNLQNNKNVNWNDKKKIDNYIKRQEQYKQMMQRQTDKLQENIKDLPKDSETIKEKKEQLKKRIEELKKLEKEQKLLEELKKLAEKLNKNELLKKVKQLTEQNKQQERSLERILELTKRFYVEQKTMQIANKLEELSKKQDSVATSPKFDLNQQKEIKKEFKEIEKELKNLEKDNKALKEPMQIPDTKAAQKEVNNQLNKAEDNNSSDKNQQQKSQKKASQKMQEMSQKMQQAMSDMEGEMKEANEKSLRIILENLLNFSFKQENLMNTFSKLSVQHPDFGKELKSQNTLKTYFEHIDDSLYVLSMRLPEISPIVQKDLTSAHYNLDQTLDNFAENRFNNALSNQQYVMTSVNNLADFLSDILDNMQQPKNSKPGKGKKGGKSFSLPDIIQKQEDIVKKMQQGKKKGEQQNGQKKGDQKGESKGNRTNELDGDLYKTYQQQSQLRQELQDALQKKGLGNNPAAKKVLKSMEELENEILEKGFNNSTLQKMQLLKYNLLKLEKAAFEQDKDTKRKSNSNQQQYNSNNAKLLIKKLFYNQTEILNRQSLPLQKNYKKKVQEYFSNSKSKKKSD
ncbi:hypothetical protein [Polaribacter uvawellassae]|uniref:hypothetical protein n=1 Tax=Polaribacter uvawellassae TaxID=3133495 RepID=UPI00321AADA5